MSQSSEVSKLIPALIEAQKAIQNPTKDKINPAFKSKYVDLGGALDACKDALSKNSLIIVQTIESDGNKDYLVTTLYHSSGEHISGRQTLEPVQKTPQGVGSAITYARRYALMALLAMAAEDDDGAAASGTAMGQVPAKRPDAAQKMRQAAQGPMKPQPRPPVGKGATGT